MNPTTIQFIGTALFAVAIVHTFSTSLFQHLAHTRPAHAGLWHLLGEVEVVFGFWASVLMLAMFLTDGATAAIRYIDSYPFIEPMFVFVIMVVAASRPVVEVIQANLKDVLSARWWLVATRRANMVNVWEGKGDPPSELEPILAWLRARCG